jgi:hypothetical protein
MNKKSNVLTTEDKNVDWNATPKDVFSKDAVEPGKVVCFIDIADFYPSVKVLVVKVGQVSYEVVGVISDVPAEMIEDALLRDLQLPPTQRRSWSGWFPITEEIREYIEKRVRKIVRGGTNGRRKIG